MSALSSSIYRSLLAIIIILVYICLRQVHIAMSIVKVHRHSQLNCWKLKVTVQLSRTRPRARVAVVNFMMATDMQGLGFYDIQCRVN